MKTTKHYSPEIRERAIRMVADHQGEYASEWAAIQSIAAKIGCTSETLGRWIRGSQKAVADAKELGGSEPERIKALEREVRELLSTGVEYFPPIGVEKFPHKTAG